MKKTYIDHNFNVINDLFTPFSFQTPIIYRPFYIFLCRKNRRLK
jgi:hypothetical protein